MLPSSEVELTFTILVVDTSVPPPDPAPSMDVLADVIIAHFPDERISFSESPNLDQFVVFHSKWTNRI